MVRKNMQHQASRRPHQMTQPLCPSSRSFVALDTAPSCHVMFLQLSVAPSTAACGFVAATSLLDRECSM